MLYEVQMVVPLLALASCLALFVCVVVIFANYQLPRVADFAVYERRKLPRGYTGRTPVVPPPVHAIRRALDLRV
jgi:hypothetical protein